MTTKLPLSGYPTPPRSPDPLSPPLTSSVQSPDFPSSSPLDPANIDNFDPLQGYAHQPHPHHNRQSSTSNLMSSAPTSGASQGGAANSSTSKRRPSTSSTGGHGGSTRRRSPAGGGGAFGSSEGDDAGWDAEGEFSPPRRAGSGAGRGRRGAEGGEQAKERYPPKDPELFSDTDDEWHEHHVAEKQSNWHHLPLVLVALPPLGAIVHGRAENWSDAIILVLICFYLYQLIKVPWDLYLSSHTRRVLPSPDSPSHSSSHDPHAIQRAASASALRRNELFCLFLCLAVPFIGAYLLIYAKGLLSDPERYINKMMIGLFCFAAGIRPLGRATDLLRKNSLYHQTFVHYPSSEVHQLRRRVEKLEEDLSQLTVAYATKSDIRTLRSGLDAPLSTLSKAVRRFARQEEYLRLSSDERFKALMEQLEELHARDEEREADLQELRRRQEEESAGVGRVALTVARHLLYAMASHRRYGEEKELGWTQRGLAWYVFAPVNVPKAAIGWGVEKAIEVVGLPADVVQNGGGVGRMGGKNGKGRRRVEGPPVV